jgi:hypothetical protein
VVGTCLNLRNIGVPAVFDGGHRGNNQNVIRTIGGG